MRNYTKKIYGVSYKIRRIGEDTIQTLKNNCGEGFVDTAVKILISVVIGALVLGGLYMLFKNTVLPTLTQKIINMFNFNG